MQKISKLFAVIIGILFLTSGIGKMLDAKQFHDLIINYGFPSLAITAPFIIIVEIGVGLALLSNIYPRKTALLAGIMLFVFTGSYLYANNFHDVTDCGCFGNMTLYETPPFVVYIRNILLFGMSLFIVKFPPKESNRHFIARIIVCFLFLITVSFVTGYTLKNSAPQKAKRHPLYLKPVKETALPQLENFSADSTYLVYIFSYRCESCWNYIENIKQYAHSSHFDRFIAFSAGEDVDREFKTTFDFEIQVIDEAVLSTLTQISPTLLYIQQDTIQHIIQGSVPSIYLFEKHYLELD